MKKFYRLALQRKKDEILLQAFHEYDKILLMKGGFVPKEPLYFEIDEGKKLYDLVGYQDLFNFAITEKLYKILIDNGVTGWSSYKITIKGENENFCGFQVLGKAGELERPKAQGFYTGYKFDYKSWDGSDFFCPQETLLIFCTEKVRNLFYTYKITNAELKDITQVEGYSAI